MTRRKTPTRRPNNSGPKRKGTGNLRIIGGIYRRRQLPVPNAPGLRPTPDRVRETLFNWLASATPGARVLDLYAGTGALGLEALSRGALESLFIENHDAAATQLETNLTRLGARGRVVKANVDHFLQHEGAPHDLVFLDPPFRQNLAERTCTLLETHGWLESHAWIYLETEAEHPPRVPISWQLHRETRAGDTIGRLYRREASPSGDAC
ncbi:16S rRNA (guanine(966)-N(2))-methyltransferase RsmD [Aidingimonas halophila]|nr:16S rRNA (guanine(966)-N(2))-methyltransferase RsmD [Aidingimonas halophila]GHC24670.1 ribosomal RNA small subunit methyltransferase D [Aidingimonas halophila]